MASAELLDKLSTIASLLNLNGKDGAMIDLKANDSEAMQLLELIIKFRERTGAETISDSEKDALLDEWDKVEDRVDDMALKVLQGAGNMELLTLEELIVKSGITLPEVALDPVFMDDVDEMKRDQMYDEIQTLRGREKQMLQLMSKMAELYSAEAQNPPECPFCGKKPPPEGADGAKGGKDGKKKKKSKKKYLKKSPSQAAAAGGGGEGEGHGANPSEETEDASEDESDEYSEASDNDDSDEPSKKPKASRKSRKGKKASFVPTSDFDGVSDGDEDDEEQERGGSRGEMLGMMAAMTMGLVKHRENEIEQRKVISKKAGRSESKRARARLRDSAASKKNLSAENEYEAFLDEVEGGDDVPAQSGVKQALQRSSSSVRGMLSAIPDSGGGEEEDDDGVPSSHPASKGLAHTKKLGRSRKVLESTNQSDVGDAGGDGGDDEDAAEGGAVSAGGGKKSKSAGGGRRPGGPEAKEPDDDAEPPPLSAEETEEASNQLERLIARIKTKKPELLKGFDLQLLLRMQKQVRCRASFFK